MLVTRLSIAVAISTTVSTNVWAFVGCQEHLPLGSPSLVTAAETTEVCHAGYATLHDDRFLIARWVAYRLVGDLTFGCLERGNNFHAETALPPERRARSSDYEGSGYDRGHLAPAQDFAWDLGRM